MKTKISVSYISSSLQFSLATNDISFYIVLRSVLTKGKSLKLKLDFDNNENIGLQFRSRVCLYNTKFLLDIFTKTMLPFNYKY
jgi:hypothetical protein